MMMARYWGGAVVVAIALLVWVPRLSGPIDLRWDGGVYYLLGTSLAEGHGYRIPSEPGSPEALQYPPLLPAVVALYERVLGTSDPAIVAPWLRKSYAGLFIVYGLAILALARRCLGPGFAVMATALCLFQVMTIFLSDLLFAELPFALVSVVFALVAGSDKLETRSWWQEAGSFVLASVGFLLRTAGLALLGAWVLEALVRRRWWLVALRGALALVPFVAWQAYVAHVRGSQEYAHPVYEYQRAPYQYYNVSYAENLFLVDPFRPELGSMNAITLATRMIANVPSLLVAVGETVSTRKGYWERVLIGPQERLLGRTVIPKNLVLIPILLLTAVVGVGIAVLVRRKAWLMVFIVLGSLGLTCMTPWPAQFTRYLSGMAPFLTICALLGFSVMHTALADRRFGITALRLAATALLALAFVMEAFSATKMFRERWSDEAKTVASKSDQTGSPLFFHDRTWQRWEETAAWVGAHASPDAIVATSAPHFFYLRTGLRAILPPMEADPARARRLLEMVPASYVIVDDLEFVDISRRYARPAVEGDPTHWRVVYSKAGTKTYQHVVSAECVQENVIFHPAQPASSK
jgi:hypothetical protein